MSHYAMVKTTKSPSDVILDHMIFDYNGAPGTLTEHQRSLFGVSTWLDLMKQLYGTLTADTRGNDGYGACTFVRNTGETTVIDLLPPDIARTRYPSAKIAS